MNRRLVLGLAASIVTFAVVAHAKLVTAQGDNGAKFNASGPGGLAIVGQASNNVTVADDGTSFTVTVALKDLDTGISLRNRHMREKYMEVDKYPNAVLVVPRAQVQAPAVGAGAQASVAGNMTLHGVTKPVTVTYAVKNDGGTYRVTGTAPININDFGIQVPSYLGVTVKPNMTVEVRFSARDQA